MHGTLCVYDYDDEDDDGCHNHFNNFDGKQKLVQSNQHRLKIILNMQSNTCNDDWA